MEQIIIGLSVFLLASWGLIAWGAIFFRKSLSDAHRNSVSSITRLEARIIHRDDQFAEVGKYANAALMLSDQGHFHESRESVRKILECLAIHQYPAIDDAFMATDQMVGDCEVSPFFMDLVRFVDHCMVNGNISQTDAEEIMWGVLKNIYTDLGHSQRMIALARELLEHQKSGAARQTGLQFGTSLNTDTSDQG